MIKVRYGFLNSEVSYRCELLAIYRPTILVRRQCIGFD